MWYAHIIADTIGAFKHVLARVIPLILNEPNSPRAATLLCGKDLKCLLISSSRFSSFLQGDYLVWTLWCFGSHTDIGK
jgi:hypothetical protein